MTEAELLEEIANVSAAIFSILKTGQSYSLGTGQSTRTFTSADLDKLRSYRRELQSELATERDGGGGVMGGF